MFSGYKAHIAMDESEIVTSFDLLQGNENEGSQLCQLLEREEEKRIRAEAVVADALYDSASNRQDIRRKGMKAYIALRRRNKQAIGFVYNPGSDSLICPRKVRSVAWFRKG